MTRRSVAALRQHLLAPSAEDVNQFPALIGLSAEEGDEHKHPRVKTRGFLRVIFVGADVHGSGAVVVPVHYPLIPIHVLVHSRRHITVVPSIYAG